jgi:hypothetical protein
MAVIARPSTLAVVSLPLAAVAFGLPWLTHFADQGLSFVALLAWLGVTIAALVRDWRRGLLAVVGVPFALFWPAAVIYLVASGELNLSF